METDMGETASYVVQFRAASLLCAAIILRTGRDHMVCPRATEAPAVAVSLYLGMFVACPRLEGQRLALWRSHSSSRCTLRHCTFRGSTRLISGQTPTRRNRAPSCSLRATCSGHRAISKGVCTRERQTSQRCLAGLPPSEGRRARAQGRPRVGLGGSPSRAEGLRAMAKCRTSHGPTIRQISIHCIRNWADAEMDSRRRSDSQTWLSGGGAAFPSPACSAQVRCVTRGF